MFILQKNQIVIYDLSYFDIDKILDSGQIFSYEKKDDYYAVVSGDKMAKVCFVDAGIVIKTKDVDYFVNFFDLKSDYSYYNNQIVEHFPNLSEIVDFGRGIRILNQDKLETIISFVISANNNITRIKKSVEYIRKNAGDKMSGYYSFPSLDKLKKLDVEFFQKAGCGYRSSQLIKLVNSLDSKMLKKFELLNVDDLREQLISLSGIGSKVADCICLFAYSKKNVCPVDTWIEKIYHDYFDENQKNRDIMRKNLMLMFGDLSGYVQQLFFFYKRSISRIKT